MAIQLVALDMDGTTLNKDQKISRGNYTAIEKALQQEIVVAVCTGRENTELTPILSLLPQVRYFISGNGCQIYDRQKDDLIFAQPIPFPVARQLYDILLRFPMMSEVYSDGKIYTARHYYEEARHYAPKQFWDFIQQTRTPIDNLGALFEDGAKPIFKVNVFYRHESNDHYHIRRLCADLPISMTSSCERNIEFGALNVSKGNALKQLAALLHIDRKNVMAIGDGSNDISMLQFADTSVAMANAADAVQEAARYATKDNDSDGVAAALYRFLPISAPENHD